MAASDELSSRSYLGILAGGVNEYLPMDLASAHKYAHSAHSSSHAGVGIDTWLTLPSAESESNEGP